MKKEKYFNADIYLNLNLGFWQALEVHCIAECCGIDAFDLSPDEIIQTIKGYDQKLIKENLNALLKELESTDIKYVSSDIFNHYSTSKDFINRIQNIVKII